jgi:hypothetical protein
MKNLPANLRTLRKTYFDPTARSQFLERKRKLCVEELLAQLDQRELERIRLQYAEGSDSIWSNHTPELWKYFGSRADLLDGRLIIFTRSRLARTAGLSVLDGRRDALPRNPAMHVQR